MQDPLFNFLITQLKYMLWVLKRTISPRLFFWAPRNKKITTILRYFFAYLDLWETIVGLSIFFVILLLALSAWQAFS